MGERSVLEGIRLERRAVCLISFKLSCQSRLIPLLRTGRRENMVLTTAGPAQFDLGAGRRRPAQPEGSSRHLRVASSLQTGINPSAGRRSGQSRSALPWVRSRREFFDSSQASVYDRDTFLAAFVTVVFAGTASVLPPSAPPWRDPDAPIDRAKPAMFSPERARLALLASCPWLFSGGARLRQLTACSAS